MTEQKQISWANVIIILVFIVYETITILFQFVFLLAGDLIEMGFDIIFIIGLVLFYDIDALILLIELIPFVDIIPLFVIYMILKISTTDVARKPLILMDFNLFKEKSLKTTPMGDTASSSLQKVYQAEDADEVCVICMQQLYDGDEVITCSNGHLAHIHHIEPWTASREFCPMCRVPYPKVLISKTYYRPSESNDRQRHAD